MKMVEPKFYYARVFMYSSLSALLFIVSFSPVFYTFSWISVENFTLNIFTIKFWLLIISPILLLLVYLSGWTVFTLIHSKIVCPIFLVPIKTGRYPLKNKNSKLIAIRVSADQTARMMLITLDFMPLIVNRYLRPFFLRCYGTKIGKNAYLSRDNKVDASPLIEIGNDVVVGQLGVISNHYITKGEIVINKVTVGNNVTIGDYAIILPGAILENNIIIESKAVVPKKHLEEGVTFLHE